MISSVYSTLTFPGFNSWLLVFSASFVRTTRLQCKLSHVLTKLSVARVLFAPFRPPWLKGSFLSGKSKEIYVRRGVLKGFCDYKIIDAIYLPFVRWVEMTNKNSCRRVIFRLSVPRVLFTPFRPPLLKGSFLLGKSKEIILLGDWYSDIYMSSRL